MATTKIKVLVITTLLFFSSVTLAMTDMTIYALSDGNYKYKNKNYSLQDFPIEQVLKDVSGDKAATVDSVAPVTVEIFPIENVSIQDLRTLVRPLALKFHRRGARVNTLFLNNIIPYLFKKK